jgi:hypothetical protein
VGKTLKDRWESHKFHYNTMLCHEWRRGTAIGNRFRYSRKFGCRSDAARTVPVNSIPSACYVLMAFPYSRRGEVVLAPGAPGLKLIFPTM